MGYVIVVAVVNRSVGFSSSTRLPVKTLVGFLFGKFILIKFRLLLIFSTSILVGINTYL